jgi:hypothetical protein
MNGLEQFEEDYIKVFETFEENQKKEYEQLTEIPTTNDINIASNIDYAVEFAKGDWTSLSSTVNSDGLVSELMHIQIDRTEKDPNHSYGTITLPANDLLKTSSPTTFSIVDLMQTIIQGRDVNNPDCFIALYFLNRFSTDQNNPFDLPYYVGDEPRCVVSYYQYDKLVKRYISYKLKNKLAGAQLSRIIYSKEMQLYDPKPIFDMKIYSLIIGDYRFSSSYVEFVYDSNPPTLDTKARDKLSFNYGNRLMFSIQRSFYSPTGNTISTRVSPSIMLTLNLEKPPSKLKVVSLQQDMAVNQVDLLYQPKSTIIYFFKYTKSDDSYSYYNKEAITISKNEMHLKNNSDSMFKDSISFPSIKSVLRNVSSSYVLLPLRTVFIQKINQEIFIPFSDIVNLL